MYDSSHEDLNNVADDFFINTTLQTTLPLPESRETILQFAEAVTREFPTMTSFYRRDSGEHVLEGEVVSKNGASSGYYVRLTKYGLAPVG